MQLILNEEKYIEHIIETKQIPKDLPKTYLITLLAKYLLSKVTDEKMLVCEVKREMLKFNFDIIEYQEYRWAKKINSVCKSVFTDKIPLKKIEYIPLFASELHKIQTLGTDREKKVLFSMYIIARFMNCNGWVNISIRDIFKFANTSITIDKQNEILRNLLASGVAMTSKKNDNLNMKVELADTNDKIVYKVFKLDKLGNQFIGNFKTGYKQCENVECNKPIKIKGTNTKYCNKCKREMELEKYKKYNKKR